METIKYAIIVVVIVIIITPAILFKHGAYYFRGRLLATVIQRNSQEFAIKELVVQRSEKHAGIMRQYIV